MSEQKQATEARPITGLTRLAAFSLRRPVTITMMFLTLVTIGMISSRLLPLESMPDIKFPFFNVFVPYEAGTPAEVERSITRPLEEAIATIGDIERLNSNSGTNGANVNIQFASGVDVDEKAMLIKEQIDLVRKDLPDDVRYIRVNKAEAGEDSIMRLRITGDRNLEGAYDLLNQYLIKPLQRVPGVARVDLQGIEPLEISIKLDNERMKRYGIGFNELQEKLRDINFNINSGNFLTDDQVIRITPQSKSDDIDDYKNLLLNDKNIRLKDVATISLVNGERNYARHLNKKYSIGIEIYKESTANLVQVAEDVLNEIEEIGETPQLTGIKLIFLDNQAEGVKKSLSDVISAGLMGSVLSLVVLFVFLRNVSMTLIISLSIPVSIIITLGVLYFAGISLNTLSLMGLMLAVGMLVDNSVVITESVFTEQQKTPEQPQRAVVDGVRAVMTPVIAGTLTTICVFLPIVVGEDNLLAIFLTHVAVAIIAALLISLALSISAVPMAISQFTRPRLKTERQGRFAFVGHYLNGLNRWQKLMLIVAVYLSTWLLAGVMDVPAENFVVMSFVGFFFLFSFFLKRHYAGLLNFFLHHRYLTLLLLVVLLVIGAIAAAMTSEDDGTGQSVDRDFWLPYHMDGSFTLDRIKKDVDRIEDYLFAHQQQFEIDSVYTYYEENGFVGTLITLIDEEKATKSVKQVKEEIIENLPKITIGTPAFRWRSSTGSQGLKLYLQGDSSSLMREELLGDVLFLLQNVEGVSNVQVEQRNSREELQVVVDRDRALNLGLNPTEVAQSVNIAMRGMNLQEFVSAGGEIPVKMRFYQKGEFEMEQLRNLPIKNNLGVTIPLENVADITSTQSPQRLFRLNRANSIQVDLDIVDEGNVKEIKEAITAAMKNVPFPAGYSWTFDQMGRGLNLSLDDLQRNLYIAIILIFMIMAAMFESIFFPLCVITSILFSYIGTFLFFAITGTTFNIMAGIGMLILIGVIVNNGIVLIDHINQLRLRGMNRYDAVIQGGKDRLRPILMTVSTTVVGLLPLSVSMSSVGGTEGPSYFPMARAIIGGLTFSTIISLLLLPCLYCWLDDLSGWFKHRLNHLMYYWYKLHGQHQQMAVLWPEKVAADEQLKSQADANSP
ncbi:efflux RND transporter permease subunit [Marinicella sediminis]|uniref:Efflux RND transporter permease subunit n=1 Tax=Marinicella sediminis TaxID=1792834 RepID=A0ABV7JAZ4_9GAMM|nr:efflux RND transporter permease subunit [Marinicella sediminis]